MNVKIYPLKQYYYYRHWYQSTKTCHRYTTPPPGVSAKGTFIKYMTSTTPGHLFIENNWRDGIPIDRNSDDLVLNNDGSGKLLSITPPGEDYDKRKIKIEIRIDKNVIGT